MVFPRGPAAPNSASRALPYGTVARTIRGQPVAILNQLVALARQREQLVEPRDRMDGEPELGLDLLRGRERALAAFPPVERDQHAGRLRAVRADQCDRLPDGRAGRDD